MTQRGMLEADAGSEGGDGGSVVRGQWWGTAEVSRGFGEGGGVDLGPTAKAVVLIPSWQAEKKCEGLCAEEAVHHCEVLCVLSIKRIGSEGCSALALGRGTQQEAH